MDRSEFIAVLTKNVTTLETAYDEAKAGCVYVWPEHWLAVKFDRDNCRAVAVNLATRVPTGDNRVFTNGKGQRAIKMSRQDALRQALAHARKMLANFEMA